MENKISPTAAPAAQQSPSSAVSVGVNQSGTAPATVQPEVDEIRRMHSALNDEARRSLDQAIRIGELLVQLKDRVGHGKWGPFVKEHLMLDERTVQNYIRLYNERDRLKSETVSDLRLTKAYLLLGKPSGRPKPRPTETPDSVSLPTNGAGDEDTSIEPSRAGTEVTCASTAEGECPDAEQPRVGAIIDGDDGSQAVPQFPFATDDDGQKESEFALRFMDGEPIIGWQDGLISTKKLERELSRMEGLWSSLPPHVSLAGQRVFVAAALEIN